MKFTFHYLLSICFLFEFSTSLNLKSKIEELKSVLSNKYQIEEFKFKEKRGWGNILDGIGNALKKGKRLGNSTIIDDAAESALAAAEKAGELANKKLTKGMSSLKRQANAGLGAAANLTGLNVSAAQKGLNDTAKKVKNAINCFFGNCPVDPEKKDDGKKDDGKKDPEKKDDGKKDPEKKDDGKKDDGKKDPEKKDDGKKDDGKKDPEKKDDGKKDDGKKDPEKKDDGKKDDGKKDPEKKDDGKKDDGKKDPEKKDDGKKDDGKKDPEKKDDGKKDPEKKDDGKKDPEKKDDGKKDDGKKDPNADSKKDPNADSKKDPNADSKKDPNGKDPAKDAAGKDGGKDPNGKDPAKDGGKDANGNPAKDAAGKDGGKDANGNPAKGAAGKDGGKDANGNPAKDAAGKDGGKDANGNPAKDAAGKDGGKDANGNPTKDANGGASGNNNKNGGSGNGGSGGQNGQGGGEELTLNKKNVQSGIDPRFRLMRTQDNFMNADNTIRFVAVDTSNVESVSIKLYFKGKPSGLSFFAQDKDPLFMDSIKECKYHKVVNNRLYNKAAANLEPINELTDVAAFEDIRFPECLTALDSGNLKTSYLNIYTLPEGVRLDKKCLKGEALNKQNSCITDMRLISTGLLHGLKLLNMGNSFIRHGNIFTHNIFLHIRNDTQRVFLDNMLYDSNKYDDINQKPFRRDMNLMGDALIQMIAGTNDTIVQEPIRSTFQIYHSIRKYIWDNVIDLSLKSAAVNAAINIKEGNGKCITRTEFDFKLQKSVFNFIYRLKCTGTHPLNQFMDIDQALNHEFITSGNLKGPNAPGEQWDTLPADY